MKLNNDPWLGHGNKYPPNFELISEDEYWAAFDHQFHNFEWTTKYLTQVEPDDFLRGKSLTLFIRPWEKTGIGFVPRVVNARGVTPLLFFKFAECVHEYGPARNVGNCLNSYTCMKCGHGETIDSS